MRATPSQTVHVLGLVEGEEHRRGLVVEYNNGSLFVVAVVPFAAHIAPDE